MIDRIVMVFILSFSSLALSQKLDDRVEALERRAMSSELQPMWHLNLGLKMSFERLQYDMGTFLLDADVIIAFQHSESVGCVAGAGLTSDLYELLCRKELGLGFGVKGGRKQFVFTTLPQIASQDYQNHFLKRADARDILVPFGDGAWLDYRLDFGPVKVQVDIGLSNGPKRNSEDEGYVLDRRDDNQDKMMDSGFDFNFDDRLRIVYRHSSSSLDTRLTNQGGGIELRYDHELLLGLWTVSLNGIEKRLDYSSSMAVFGGVMYQPIYYDTVKRFQLHAQVERNRFSNEPIESIYSYGIGYKSRDGVGLGIGGSHRRSLDQERDKVFVEQGFLARLTYSH